MHAQRIIGYYASWSIYARNYHVPQIPADSITHINYAFANIANGQIILGDAFADTDRFYPGDCWDPGCRRGCFHQLEILKAAHPHVKTLISVGGWTWSEHFSDVALTEQSRRTFASSCAAFVNQYEFDGVDIDWEYPVEGGEPDTPHRPEDGHNFTLLMAQLRAALDSLGQANGHPYYLSCATSAEPTHIGHLELPLLAASVDWINIMTYDFHGPWGPPADAVTNLNSPLAAVPEDPTVEPYHSVFNLMSAVQAYVAGGIPPAKLNAGIPFYGRGYGNVADQNNGLFVSYSGAAPDGTWENGSFDYWDLAQSYVNANGYTRFWQGSANVPWLYNPATHIMISYDDSLSVALKALWLAEGSVGAMFWEFSGDRDGVLLGSLYRALTGPRDVTAYLSPDGAHLQIRFEATLSGIYRLYSTTNCGTPFAPGSPGWVLEANLTVAAPGQILWTDPTPLLTSQCFVVTYDYGEPR